MNIVVRTYGGHTVVRPDTTWERDGDDLYVPEFIGSLSYAPVFTAHICKAGKSVSPRFADRYIDAIGFGVLLYPDELLDGSEEGFASASCLDHTSVLPSAMSARTALGNAQEPFILYKDGKEIFRSGKTDTGMIESAISEASSFVSLRIGDMIAIELAEPAALADREAQSDADRTGTSMYRNEIRGTFRGEGLFCFNIIFCWLSHSWDSNPRPTRYECVALPTELKWLANSLTGHLFRKGLQS